MSNWGVKKKVVLEVKFPDWNSMEDIYLREKAKGYKMDVRDVFVYHLHRSTLKTYLQQNIRNGMAETQYRRYKKDKKWVYGYITAFLAIVTLFSVSILFQYYIFIILFFVTYVGFLLHRRYGTFKSIYKQYGFEVLTGSIILHNISVIGTIYGIIKEIVRGAK